MKTTTVTEARAHLSSLIRLVRGGETVVILARGTPVARLEPIRGAELGVPEEHLLHLVRRGVVRRGTQLPDAAVLGRPGKRRPSRRGLLEALLRDRSEGP